MSLDTATLYASVTIANFAGAFFICIFSVSLKTLQPTTRRACMMWCAAISLAGVGCTLVGLRGQISDLLSIELANALLLAGHYLRPNALNLFYRRNLRLISLPVIVPAVWLGLCLVPEFRTSLTARIGFVQAAFLSAIMVSVWISLRQNRAGLVTGRLVVLAMGVEACGYVLFVINHLVNRNPDFMSSFGTTMSSVYLVLILVSMVLMTILIPAMAIEQLQMHYRDQAWQDPLTGLSNRRSFEREAGKIVARQAECNQPHALIILDTDGLATINDRFGRPMGDAILRLTAKVCQQVAPDSSLIGRTGDDTFCLLLPEATQSKAVALTKQIGHIIKFETARASNNRMRVTTSAGIYWGWSSHSLTEAQEIASACLRRAQNQGGGAVVTNMDSRAAASGKRDQAAAFSSRRSNAA